jgi:AraC family transcriptional regulator
MTSKNNEGINASVEVKELPEYSAAYIRHVGPYMGNSELFGRLFGQLMAWAGPRGLMGPDTRIFSLYEDNPGITDEEKLRMSVCISVPADTKVEGEIGKRAIAGGKYAVGHFELLSPDQYADAWTSIYSGWFPESGFQPDDGPPLEFYLSDPGDDPEGRITVEIAVPVKPM